MDARLNIVTLGVADVARARRFYETLGWKASGASNEHIAFFQLGGTVLGLFGRAALAEDAQVADGSGFGGITLAQNVQDKGDVDRLLAEAAAAGATLLKPGQDVFWGGYSGYFADPDGHPWEIAWNPHLQLGPDGALRLPD